MKLNLPERFLVIDDDPINNMICAHVLKSISSKAEIKCFTLPEQGIEFILSHYENKSHPTPTILFLDLNMPEISGWDFLNRFSSFEKKITEQFTIFILSSSVDDSDIKKAKEISIVKDYIIKPLTAEQLTILF